MQGDPIWITGDAITIVKNYNGFAVVQTPADPASQALVFQAWADLSYYLAGHFAAPAV
jgi:hypothetical protein